ncbi:MAG TPA: aldo/keto reductase [Verrucomicrobiae bacterium]|nr:aldo/keto reductase [Verrucomicrobiae bacterium]
MKQVIKLPGGEFVPALGLGTWRLGENPSARQEEIAALRLGIERGATLIDTAEMYGDGSSEELVCEAVRGRREQIFLVTKVLPRNASRKGTLAACEASLRRLGTDRIDLYLLHWRGSVPLAETVEAFLQLKQAGKIRYFGVSNFDADDMKELWSIPGGSDAQTDQVLYNLSRRGIEWDLLPALRKPGIPLMAYSPIEQASLVRDSRLMRFADRHGMTPAQAALAWLLAKPDVIVIPKSGQRERMEENLGALEVELTPDQLGELDRLFPPPDGPHSLEIL